MEAALLFAPLYSNLASAQQVLVNYAGAALVRSRCLRVTGKKAKSHEPIEYSEDNVWIESAFWEAYADSQRRVYEDWGTGHFAANRWMTKEWWQYRVFGVHFAEDDIRVIPGIAPKPAPPPQPLYRAKRPAPSKRPDYVSPGELRPWFESYLLHATNFRAGRVQAAAAAHFAPSFVSRDPIRDLIRDFGKTENRGKPVSYK
jgi:hypothetical protein